ncbi:MAG: hypothetical protein WKG07_45915 [Hymenobacter sp.]
MGADHIAANGDVANKVGTYGLAVLARHHAIPFYVAAPMSTVDLGCPTGADIPIEGAPVTSSRQSRPARSPRRLRRRQPGLRCHPATLITAIVTEDGVLRPLSFWLQLAACERRAAATSIW